MNRADIAALAHTVAVQLALFGVIARNDVGGVEGSISTGITAAAALISQAVIFWKYLHHDAQMAERRFSLDSANQRGDCTLEREKRAYENQLRHLEVMKRIEEAKQSTEGTNMRTITIVNQSTVVNAADFAAAVAACQRQVNDHFGPAWGGLSAHLVAQTAVSPQAPHDVAGECIYVLDDSDQQGALGYHELTAGDAPVGYVFAKTSQDAGDPWQTTLSHELLEQMADPYIDTCVEVQLPHASGRNGLVGLFGHRQGQMAIVAYEVADPCENDTYEIDGVPVSNFVLPAWFQSASTPGIAGPFDYLGKLTAPLTLTPGGYISYATRLGAWQQFSARQSVRPEKYLRRGKKLRRAA